MRNRWFPRRIANYVPAAQLKQLKAEGVAMERDVDFGVRRPLMEVEDGGEDGGEDGEEEAGQRTHYVRPVEINFLTVWCSIFKLSC